MARYTSAIGFFLYLFISLVRASEDKDRIYFNEENMRRWNTPPELTVNRGKHQTNDNYTPHARFIPFSASFTLSPGANNAHSLSVDGTNNGISLSQSQSSSSGSFGRTESGSSTSQSSSFSAGLSGISASDASAFNLNHPIFGTKSKTNTNSFSLGQAAASAHGNIVNNQASTNAQSSTGSGDYHSLLSPTTSPNGGKQPNSASTQMNSTPIRGHGHRSGKPWTNIRPNYEMQSTFTPPLKQKKDKHHGWYENPRGGPSLSEWSQNNNRNPTLQISAASASSGSSSMSSNGFAFSQSMSQSNWGPDGLMSWTNNRVQTSGIAESNAQGAAAAVGQTTNGKTQASFSSGAIFGSSAANGNSQGISLSNNRNGNSQGDVTSHIGGISNVQGTANAGSVSVVRFPEDTNVRNIPAEFIRSEGSQADRKIDRSKKFRMHQRDPLDKFFIDIADTIEDLFEI